MTAIGALFAGYGGLEMGVQAVLGGDLVWYSEIDKGALKILGHHHPDVPNVGDITAVDWSSVEPVDVLTGGFPCQDPQLAPTFVEWLMGLPPGHVTDTPGITRNEALKALGNGVVPQQAETALRFVLEHIGQAAA